MKSLRECTQIADQNIAEVFTEVSEMSDLPKIIQHYIKHCIHALASDVMKEQEVYKGQIRTHLQWSDRQTAHILGDVEELEFVLSENVIRGIKIVLYNTALYAERERLTSENN